MEDNRERTSTRTVDVEISEELAEQLHESTDCPICGRETADHVRYMSCPEHGVVLKAVRRIVGYRPLSNAKEALDDTETGENR